MWIRQTIFIFLVLLGVVQPVRPCSYCNPNFQQKLTLRQNGRIAKFIVIGTLHNPRLDGEKGATDFQIEQVVQSDPALGNQKQLTIPTYVPGDPKKPQRYLLFADFINGKLDIVHSSPITENSAGDYLRGSLKIDDRDRTAVLQYCYKYLDAADPEVADDAFHEFAKATDQEIVQIAGKLSPDKFRTAIGDPRTPADRVGMYAYLLGACGNRDDAPLLVALIQKKDERGNAALSGLLGGLIELRPDLGWPLLQKILTDPQRPFVDKFYVQGTIRFYHSSKPRESRKEILQCMGALIEQGDLADLAIQDLRQWQWWDLTTGILAQYGKPTHRAPIVRNAIVRYALCCPDIEAADFVKSRTAAEPMLVSRIKESLEFEKPISPKKNP